MAEGSLEPFARLIREVPWIRTAGILVLMLLAALTEGVGIMMLVPMLGVLSGGSSSAASFLDTLGLSGSIVSLLSLFVGLVIARALLVHAHMFAGLRFQHEAVDGLREACFGGLIRSEWRWLSQTRSSDHASLLTSNIIRVGLGLHQLLALISTSFAALACLGAAFLLSWPVAIAATLGGIFALFAFKGHRRQAVELGSELGKANRVLQSQVQEGLSGVRLTKILGQEQNQQSRLKGALSNLRDKVYRHAVSTSVGRIAMQAGGAVLMSLLVYCGLAIWKVPLAVLLPVLLVFARLVPMIEGIQQAWNYWLHSAPALQEAFSLIDEAKRFAEPQGSGPALPLQKQLFVEDVSFSYGDRTAASLVNINFRLPAFSTTAIIGTSGAGKSSLADLIMGLISPDKGRVMVDDLEITGAARQAWRRSVAYVQQDAFLFHDTVRANLQVAKANASEADLAAALKLASADFVFRLPDELDTLVGDGGVRLSGGERQRIALARALLGEPQLLILDEATSALDPENERDVWKAISALRGKITLLIVGHRLAMLDQADQIIRIEGGRITAIEQPKTLGMCHA